MGNLGRGTWNLFRFSRRRDGIVAPPRQGVAPEDAADGQVEGCGKAVGVEAFEGVVRTGGLEAAGTGGQEKEALDRAEGLVETNQGNCSAGEDFIEGVNRIGHQKI